jgi:tetratricopeptide (TPR) repeat protein
MRETKRHSALSVFVSVILAGFLLAPAWAETTDRERHLCGGAATRDARIAACTRVLARGAGLSNNDRALALNNRGANYKDKGELERSLADLNEAIRLNPKNAGFYANRGNTYNALRDQDSALRDFAEAIRLDPKVSPAYANRGLTYLERQEYDRAIADLDEAIRLGVRVSAVFGNRGFALTARRDLEAAIRDYDQALRLDPRNFSAYNNRGYARLLKRDFDQAVRDFDAAIRISPTFAAALAMRGEAYRQKGELDRALADLDSALRLDPKLIFAYAYRGLLHEARRNAERATADYQVALTLPQSNFIRRLAHETARERLEALVKTAAQPAAPSQADVASVPSGKRVALVIGNSAYPGGARLANPVNDAEDVADALTKVGFEVVKGRDLSLSGFGETIAAFRQKAAGADVALFYYAGHGMQFDDQNWLLPVDAKAKTLFEARRQFVPLAEAIAEVEARAGTTLVFLDSCRDNPLEEDLKASFKSQGRGYGDTRGLARLDIKSPQTLVVYATRPNTTAADGQGRNSPFTEAFLQHVATPGVEIEVLMKRVSAAVASRTKGKQQPERLSRLESEFYFVPAR